MKYIIAVMLVLGSLTASANVIKDECRFDDYQLLNDSLENEEIVDGNQYKEELLALLAQEMGPECYALTELNVIGIPGTDYFKYSIVGESGVYQVVISVSRVENPGTRVSIEKLFAAPWLR